MTIKLKAPRAWGDHEQLLDASQYKTDYANPKPVRIVRESDYRKLLRLVKEADLYIQGCEREKQHMPLPLIHALDALKGKSDE